MSELSVDHGDQRVALLGLYDTALPEVYGYLASRCGSASVAEDLTSETFLAAVDAVKRRTIRELTVAWLIGVARNKLVDHWRRRERESKVLQAVGDDPTADAEEQWDVQLDALVAHETLASLGTHHRSALTLRYLDGLPVREVADHLGRTEGATEVLLVRARAAFRASTSPSSTLEGRPDHDRSLRRPAHTASAVSPPPALRARSCAPSWSRSSVLAPGGPARQPAREEGHAHSTVTSTTTASLAAAVEAGDAAVLTPYLAVSDGAAAIAWYAEALGAVEQFRVVGDDGRVGHAELLIGPARFMLADEYPEIGVLSPATLGGTPLALHLSVDDVDRLFERAVNAGAESLSPPADQPHGARHGTLLDPYGHRWMLSQQLEDIDLDTYRQRSAGTGFEVLGAAPDERVAAADRPGTGGGIWAGVFYDDALAAIRFMVDVFGFEEQLVVTGDDGRTVVHSQLRWPEGGIVQVGTADPSNEFTHAPGDQALYVVTADPQAVWERCEAAGLDVIRPPESPDYDPDGMGFSVRDREGNIWSFGSYGHGAEEPTV